jgi:hypothetical protein
MREYKFKAYDTVNKIMVDIDGDSLYLADGLFYEVEERSCSYTMYIHKEDVSKRYIPVQFTGQIAKANSDEINWWNLDTEIYEGHIVKCLVGGNGHIGQVYWNGYAFDVKGYNEPCNDYPSLAFSDREEFEIIGWEMPTE